MSAELGNLGKVEQIVVLMLENRSFDHMLGYLSLDAADGGRGRTDIDGLKAGMSNEHDGATYAVHHLTRTAFEPFEDPDHSGDATSLQMADGEMSGFVDSFAAILAERDAVDGDPGLVMGYYNAGDLPTYDHLAAEFCVCDKWHSSVPGATWPNRLYALTGRADGSRDDKPSGPPLYDIPSFVRHLDAHGVPWRWYSYDPGTLRCVDRLYWLDHWDNFAYVEKTKLSWKTEIEELPVIDEWSSSFLEDAANGRLAAVSWIDPNFKDLNLYGGDSNDDHPPSDVRDGQQLVLSVYDALASGPQWDSTLLIITYDEHGGFFDHVAPPMAEDDDPETFGRYGIRVPAIIVSPWVPRGSVSSTLFDHTSIIKTILRRFCHGDSLDKPSPMAAFREWLEPGHPHYLGKRTARANDLEALLTQAEPRPAPERQQLVRDAADRKANDVRQAFTGAKRRTALPHLSDLQTSVALAARRLRRDGLPPEQP